MKHKHPHINHIHDYLKGELDAKTMHELEKLAHADPFLMDALEGYELIEGDHHASHTELEDLLAKRIEKEQQDMVAYWRFLPIAASLLFIVGIGWILLEIKKPLEVNKAIASKKMPKPAQGIITGSLPLAARGSTKKQTRRQAETSAGPVNFSARYANSIASLQKHRPAAASARPQNDGGVDSAIQGRVAGINTTLAKKALTKIPIKPPAIASQVPDITGMVTDATGEALPGARVALSNGNAVSTDTEGKFIIKSNQQNDSILVQMLGYVTKKVPVTENRELNIKLAQSTNSLAEVVVERKAVAPTPHLLPEPLAGWKSYIAYIRQNAVMPNGETGRVKLVFMVDTNGSISDIKVIRGHSLAMNQRAIDLVKNGPLWAGSTDEALRKVKLKIRFHKA